MLARFQARSGQPGRQCQPCEAGTSGQHGLPPCGVPDQLAGIALAQKGELTPKADRPVSPERFRSLASSTSRSAWLRRGHGSLLPESSRHTPQAPVRKQVELRMTQGRHPTSEPAGWPGGPGLWPVCVVLGAFAVERADSGDHRQCTVQGSGTGLAVRRGAADTDRHVDWPVTGALTWFPGS